MSERRERVAREGYVSRLAWHWVGDTLRDGRPIPPDGKTLVHDGPVEMCSSGLHASRRVLDALRYAPGHTVCRVEVGGIEEEGDDKLVCRERTILWRTDAEEILLDFARRCALDVIHLWDAPDVVREYLETGDEGLRDAAWRATRDASRATTASAARAARAASRATRDASRAAREASRAAPWAAASAAAWATTWKPSPGRQRAVTWRATRNVARDRQNRRLTEMVCAGRRRPYSTGAGGE